MECRSIESMVTEAKDPECKGRESRDFSASFSPSFSPCSSVDAYRAEENFTQAGLPLICCSDPLHASLPSSMNPTGTASFLPDSRNQTGTASFLDCEQMAMDDHRSSTNSAQPCLETPSQQDVQFSSDSPSLLPCSRKRIDEHLEDRNGQDALNTPSQLVLLGNSSVQKTSQCAPVLERSEEFTTCRFPPSTAGRASLMRTCKLCGTTKTPLWRSGPQGPKSLCNACGIRFKKSRRAQATGDFLDLQASTSPMPAYSKLSARPMNRKLVIDEGNKALKGRSPQSSWPTWMVVRKSSISKVVESSPGTLPPRKRISSGSVRRKDSTAMLALLEKRGKITSVFAKDEEEAAVMLMALSCGLVQA